MRILMIATTYPRFEGDTAAPFIASIAEGIVALGHTVDMVVPFHPKLTPGMRNGVQVHPYHVPGDRNHPLWGYAQSMEADQAKRHRMVWEIERRLVEDGAKPLVYFNRGGICWDPKVKNITVMSNSIYNGWRMEDVWLEH